MARSTTFSSSRMLPGQWYCSSTARASGVTPRTSLPSSVRTFLMKWATSRGMSSRRSRSGGRWTGMTFRR